MTDKSLTAKQPPRCALLASGRGSNALSILEFQKSHPTLFDIPLLVTDNPKAGVLEKLESFDVKAQVCPVPRTKGLSRDDRRKEHEKALLNTLKEHQIHWLILAGYKRLLSPDLLSHFWSKDREHYRVINIHPSLLPAYPGLDAYVRAFEDGVDVSGITVHFVDAGMDTGPILAQEKFSRYSSDDLQTFQDRGLKIEHRLYPDTLKKVFLNQYEISQKTSEKNLNSQSEG